MAKLFQKYGIGWQDAEPVSIELECIKRGGLWDSPNGTKVGAGLPAHVIALSQLLWPWVKWHRWAKDLMIPEFCKGGRLAVFGPSSSGKSFLASLFALVMYFARPDNTTVLVSSTTREELELRAWGEIKKLWKRAKERVSWLPGHLTDSKQLITTDGKEVEGRDFRNGLVGRPCRKGSEWVGLGPMVGIKNDYIIVIADESHLMPDGFLKALANLAVNPSCTSIVLGNLNDLNTPLGEAAEPDLGWDALVDSDISRVYPTRWLGGRAIQLVGQDSPNLDYPEGAEPFAPLIGRRYLKECEHNYGLDTPLFNMFAAGKIPRATMENRVITKQVCQKHGAFEPVVWGHEPIVRFYSADISYTAEHGDRSCGIPFGMGYDVDGKMRIAPLDRPTVFRPSDRLAGTIEEQIATSIRDECRKWQVPSAYNFFFDGTGRSSFTSAIMRIWSTDVQAVEFGGRASERDNFIGRRFPEGKEQGKLLPCNMVFGKLVTELWFATRALIEAGQLRNLSEEVAKEGYLRLWYLTMGNKIDVEPKKEMKKRLGRSPDLYDAFVVGIEGARRLGFPLGKADAPRKSNDWWMRKIAREYNEALKEQELSA